MSSSGGVLIIFWREKGNRNSANIVKFLGKIFTFKNILEKSAIYHRKNVKTEGFGKVKNLVSRSASKKAWSSHKEVCKIDAKLKSPLV